MNNVWFFPRSLRQLVLLAFLLVLLPLLILAGQAYKSLNGLSEQVLSINRVALSDTQRSEMLLNISLNMERTYQQLCVLDDGSLKDVYQNKYYQYVSLLEDHKQILSHDLFEQLKQTAESIQKLQCNEGKPTNEVTQLLEKFSLLNTNVVQQTKESKFLQAKALQHSIAERGSFFGHLALLLFLLSLLLVLLFTRMIIGPVNRVKEMIDQLGDGGSLSENFSFKGPKEILVVAQRIIWLSQRLTVLESQRYEFLRHLSHEFKTPLASIREGTELLADQVVGNLTQDQKDVVTILDNSSRLLQRLIEQLIDYNRRLANISYEPTSIDLAEIIDSVIIAHSLSARSKSMLTECNLNVKTCCCVETLLMRVVDNIYSNAVHYGQESGTIWITSYYKENHLIIDIANQGDSIPEDERIKLFEPFYQGSKQRKSAVKGSGLGLSIARDSIYRMKGELQLVDVDYTNVCFRIILPQMLNENE